MTAQSRRANSNPYANPGKAHYNPYSGHNPQRRPDHTMKAMKGAVQFTIAVIVAAIPISFYLVQPSDIQNALASNNKDSDIKRIISTIGGTIKQQASGVFGSNKSMRVQAGAPQPQTHQPQQAPAAGTNLPGTQTTQVADASEPSESLDSVMDDTAMEHAAKHANPTYVCPMHPDVITDDPDAICPICGMDLVPLETGGEAGTVKLTPTVINTLGVRTEKVKKRTLFRTIDSVGYVEMDDANIRTVNLRVDGWIEKLYVKTEGDRVKAGDPLFELYSPKLVNAQEEYVQAMRNNNSMLVKASRERLASLGISADQIEQLQTQEDVKQHVEFYAPQDGIISKFDIREGQYVKPSKTLLEIVDLGSIWIIAEIFETQADWVKKGQRAQASLPYLPGKRWEGMVDYVYPSLDPGTRSLKVRLQFDNPEESLKPNMYADVEIYAKPKRKVLTIPREALIVTGDQNRVIVALGEGKFIPMNVRVGMTTDRGVEILHGLAEGDEVVTSSQFLIDSESSLKASLARMAGGG
ncbi:MAG: efflux RND transporter periplasmic adaptor subunit [Gammaproteobacteria bacterium]|jgi:Cu(I)/Ag(I) efflux system membrane fusion protein